jgi:hypothetical protein
LFNSERERHVTHQALADLSLLRLLALLGSAVVAVGLSIAFAPNARFRLIRCAHPFGAVLELVQPSAVPVAASMRLTPPDNDAIHPPDGAFGVVCVFFVILLKAKPKACH